MEIPAGWTYRPATEEWPAHSPSDPTAPFADHFAAPQGRPLIFVFRQSLPADQTEQQFTDQVDVENSRGCESQEPEQITVAGVGARLVRRSCAGGQEAILEILLYDAGRAYEIYFVGQVLQVAEDEPLFLSLLDTFQLPQ